MHVDFTGAGRLERCPPEWFGRWEEAGIDMRSVVEEKYYWHDFEVLRYMNEYGARRFWLDDIWGFDWEACRLHAKHHTIAGVPDAPVNAPPRALVLAMRRSEEHTSELQSQSNLVCRLLLEKKKHSGWVWPVESKRDPLHAPR